MVASHPIEHVPYLHPHLPYLNHPQHLLQLYLHRVHQQLLLYYSLEELPCAFLEQRRRTQLLLIELDPEELVKLL